MLEATLPRPSATAPRPPHADRGGRARAARRARGASSSRTSPTSSTTLARARDAEQAFGGPVLVAAEGAVYEV